MPIGETDLQRFVIKGAFSDHYWLSSAPLNANDSGLFAMSLPSLSNTVFMCVSKEPKAIVERLICEVNVQSESTDIYQAGYARRLQNHYLNQFGWGALLFAETKDFVKELPNTLKVDGEVFDFVLVIPITHAEYRKWQSCGYQGLIAQFAEQGRRLVKRNVKEAERMDRIPMMLQPGTENADAQRRTNLKQPHKTVSAHPHASTAPRQHSRPIASAPIATRRSSSTRSVTPSPVLSAKRSQQAVTSTPATPPQACPAPSQAQHMPSTGNKTEKAAAV
jgi:hypothetical protein